MINLYKMYLDCGRMGSLGGLFIASPEDLEAAYSSTVYFGEALGKHSEVYFELAPGHIEMLSDDQEKVKWLAKIVGGEYASGITISGWNPLEYIEDEL